MFTIKSYAAKSAKAPLEPFPLERRDVRDNDVLIDMKSLK